MTGALKVLTSKQRELLLFIHQKIKETGVSPSFDEMKDALNLASKSGIHRLITALEERGFIARLHHRARALEVLKLPQEATASAPPAGRHTFQPSVVATVHETAHGDMRSVPILGRIAAGTPKEAIEHEIDQIALPEGLPEGPEYFALRVSGESMINAGILDGDTVILRKTDTANTNEIVVALVDDSEATLKKFRRNGHAVALEPANAAFETRIYAPDQVQIQGRLVALLRCYE